ncbi:MAG: two-component sensor histidine kinase [Firmicutes bacterium]|nr:two-component sensor histidine kinase [Bacillota bacterium]
MKKFLLRFSNLPIKWKLALWSAMLLFLLIVVYNSVQYMVISRWIYQREQSSLQSNIATIKSYFGENEEEALEEDLEKSKVFLEKVNEHNQLVRVVASDGKSVLTVTNDVSTDWVTPKFVQTSEMNEQQHEEDRLLIARTPLITPKFTGTIEIVRNIETLNQLLKIILTAMLIGGIGAILLSALGGIMISRQLLIPVKALADTMHNVQEKGLQERMQVYETKDELAELSTIFNAMMDKLELSFQQQKQFVEDASHELRTPIAIVEGHLSLLERWGKNDPAVLQESLNASLQETRRLKILVQELLALSQAESPGEYTDTANVSPMTVIEQVVQNMVILHEDVQFSVTVALLEGMRVVITANHLEQILLILLDNAVKYSTTVKKVVIRGYVAEPYVCIAVQNFGIGIPKQELPYIFDRFYRVDKARNRKTGGSGLGLSIARHLIQNYGGSIIVQSEVGGETIFTIKLPIQYS